MKLEFPAPTRPLSINESNRMHWAQRRNRLKPWAVCTAEAFANASAEDKAAVTNTHVTISVTIPFERNARRDPHNYVSTVVKTVVDALIRAGMAPDDTPEWVSVEEPHILVDKSAQVGIVVRPTSNDRRTA